LEKAIEIKRRAQRCVQNGDVDGALREYEKLVETPESDPYNFVLLADLLYKKGEQGKAAERYLSAVQAYQTAGLYKNAIAVCKKMSRLSLSQSMVLRHLADLHALDGLAGEASMYYAQYADFMMRSNNATEAVQALRKAFDLAQENVRLLEQLSELLLIEGETAQAAAAMLEAERHWQSRGQSMEAKRCHARASLIDPSAAPAGPVSQVVSPPGLPPRLVVKPAESAPEPAPPAAAPVPVSVPVATTPGLIAGLVAGPPPASTPAPGEVQLSENGSSPVPSAYLDRPEPPPTGGILTGSRIPGVTAPSIDAGQSPQPPVERGPTFSPALFETKPMSGLTSSPAFGVSAPPPADTTGFEPQRAFVAPTPGPSANEAEEAVTAEGVYEIGAEEASSYESALQEVQQPDPTPRPTPFAQAPAPAEPTPSMIARHPEELLGGVANVEGLLQRAQDEFRAGKRESASQALVEAALAYERLGRLDSAATIFRSLGRGASAPVGVMELWLANCEKRRDRAEGSQVACELGDRALNDGHEDQARRWFEHSLALDPANDTASRRIQRMMSPPPAAPAPTPSGASAGPESGRVAVAVGRGRAVTFDLQGLLQEFQRGVESQLEGDAQGHYDLGMAYREMGLHDEAIGAFRIAERDERLAQRAREMIGRSFADSGRYEDAVREFESALQLLPLDAPAEAELRYQLAMSMAAAGEMADAMAQMEIADMRFPGRPDIQQRLAEWRRTFGQAA
jgi:tetratricopeptide (TPR) repeat protein